MSLRRAISAPVLTLFVVLCFLNQVAAQSPTLISISVTPVSASISSGSTQQFIATGNFSDGSSQNITGSVTWTSSNSFSVTIGSTGVALGLIPGNVVITAVSGSISGSAQATVTTTANLAGWWLLGDGAGTSAADSSGNGDTATLVNGVSWVTGQNGDAISANGTNQYVSIPAVNLSTTRAVTWTAWINRTYGSGVGALIENSTNFNNSTTGFGFFPDDSPDCGIPNTMMTGVKGDAGYTLNCYTQPTSGVWHHIAAIYDKSQTGANVISLYIDGVLQTPAKQWLTSTNTNDFGDNPIYLFSRGGASNFAAGEMDDLRLYSVALTATQIEQIYQQGLGPLTSISVTPAGSTLSTGSTSQYTATGTFSNGSTANISAAVTWSSTNTSTATVNSSGLATGVAAGTTIIKATSGSITGSTSLTVLAGRSLVSIAVTPSNISLPPGGTQQLTATGTYSDSTTQNLTNSVTWSSTNTAAVTVSSSGLVTGVTNGSGTITAVSGSISGSAQATVTTTANLAGWWLLGDGAGTSAADSSGNGDTATLVNGVSWVTGQNGDAISANGTNQYVSIPAVNLSTTRAVTWTAWINRTYGSGVGALIENSTNFNNSTTGFGFFPDDSPDCGIPNTMMTGVKGDAGYTLNCYTQPTSGVWHHIAAIYDKSQTGANVISLYIDGVLQTPAKQWLTSTNTNDFGDNPIYLFSRGGASNFAAGEMDDLRLYSVALTATQIEQIYQQGLGPLTSISVTPAGSTLSTGSTSQYTATGTFSNGSTANISAAVTWSSTNTSTATVNSSGLATGVAAGTTIIKATSGSITGSTSLTVNTAPTLLSISITPANISIPVSGSLQLTATGNYSDGSTQNLTYAVVWSSSNVSAATISSAGLVAGVATGVTNIQATYGSSTAQTTMIVSPPTGQFIQWASDDGGPVASETTYQDHNATTGNLILVLGHWDNQSATASVHDQLGNTYTPIFSPTNAGTADRFQVWYAKNITGGVPLAVTATFSAQTASISTIDVIEYAGLNASAPLDVYTSATGIGTNQSSGNMPTTTYANETIIGLFGYVGYASPYNAGSGFTFRNYDASTMLEDMPVSSQGTYSAQATSLTSTSWAAFAIGMRDQLPVPPGLAISPSSVVAGNGPTGTVELSSPAPTGGAVVTLISSQPSAAAVPASVTVPAGSTIASFAISTGSVTFATKVTIYATYSTTASATFTVVPVTMAQVASDNFNRANAATLGKNWTPLVGAATNVALQVVNDQIEAASAGGSIGKEMYYGGQNWTPDQYSQVQIAAASGGGYEGPSVRMTSNDTHYSCLVYSVGAGSAAVGIVLDNASTYSTLASSTTSTVSLGDLIRCTMQGTTLTMTDVSSSTTLLTATDTTIPSGYPGLVDSPGPATINYVMSNWSAGASAAPLTSTQLASDNFNRANALNLGSNWVVGSGHGPVQIVSDQVQPYPGGGTQPSKEHYIKYGPFPNDQWAQLQAVVDDTIGDLAVELRASDTSDTMYVLDLNITGGPGVAETRIVKVINGTITPLIIDQQWSSVSPGDYILGQVQGSLITLIDETTGTLLLSTIDTSVTSGYPGVSMQAVTGNPSDHIAANWSAGSLQ